MASGSAMGTQAEDDGADANVDGASVSAFESSPDRMVFTEDDNPDGWIATDLVMEPPR